SATCSTATRSSTDATPTTAARVPAGVGRRVVEVTSPAFQTGATRTSALGTVASRATLARRDPWSAPSSGLPEAFTCRSVATVDKDRTAHRRCLALGRTE